MTACPFCSEHHPGGVTKAQAAAGHPFAVDVGRGIQYVRQTGSPSPWTDGSAYPTLEELRRGFVAEVAP